MEALRKLQDLDCSTVKRFSFEGIDTLARVANIHDPDTITIIFELNEKMVKINVRLDGIDAPELKSKIDAESNACLKGNLRLKEIIEDKVIRVVLDKYDKYGRVIARLYTLDPIEDDTTCVNDYLISYQYVRSYDGGAKAKWTQDELDSVGKKKQPSDPIKIKKTRIRKPKIGI